jgi:hypothetical protein
MDTCANPNQPIDETKLERLREAFTKSYRKTHSNKERKRWIDENTHIVSGQRRSFPITMGAESPPNSDMRNL